MASALYDQIWVYGLCSIPGTTKHGREAQCSALAKQQRTRSLLNLEKLTGIGLRQY